jgi:hypothetical protein
MRVRILLQVAADEADFSAVEEVATFEKCTAGIENLGLSLAEGKILLAATQQRVIERQTAAWLEQRRHCACCVTSEAVRYSRGRASALVRRRGTVGFSMVGAATRAAVRALCCMAPV